jgi:hypothetical protein
MLYAGTSRPLPRREWDKDAPNVCVKSLSETDMNIASHFTQPEVQYVGSTSGCGCDFPHKTRYSEVVEIDSELEASERFNCERLVRLLRDSGEAMVELYGIWLSDWKEDPPRAEMLREDIPLTKILEPAFRFRAFGFYRVNCAQIGN